MNLLKREYYLHFLEILCVENDREFLQSFLTEYRIDELAMLLNPDSNERLYSKVKNPREIPWIKKMLSYI
jgi:hypothetical protein